MGTIRPDYKHHEKGTYYGCTLDSNPTHAATTSWILEMQFNLQRNKDSDLLKTTKT